MHMKEHDAVEALARRIFDDDILFNKLIVARAYDKSVGTRMSLRSAFIAARKEYDEADLYVPARKISNHVLTDQHGLFIAALARELKSLYAWARDEAKLGRYIDEARAMCAGDGKVGLDGDAIKRAWREVSRDKLTYKNIRALGGDYGIDRADG